MKKHFVRKRGDTLEMVDDAGKKMLAKHADGDELLIALHQVRDRSFFRKWWKLCSVVADNMPESFADDRAVSDMILIACREVDWRVNPKTGDHWPVPRSIAIGNMDEDVAQRLWRRAVFWVCSELVPIAPEALQTEIDEFFAGPEARSLGRRAGRGVTEQHGARAA